MNVDEALNKYTPVLDETLVEMDSQVKVVEEKKQVLEKAADNIEQIQKELAVQIRQTFDRMRDAIDERERELFNLSEHEIDKKRNEIGDQLAMVHDRESHLNKDRTNLQNAKESKDISAMFTHHQSAREVLAKKIEIPGPSRATKDFAVSFQFNSRAENNIRSNISVFGDVNFK
jgi:septation ring formation regulator EzrA